MSKARIEIPQERLAEYCRKHRIRNLALFGSVLTDDFGPDSDVDVLVEFKVGTRIGMIRLARIESELSEIIGRRVDLNTLGFINKRYRSRVLMEKEVQYAEA